MNTVAILLVLIQLDIHSKLSLFTNTFLSSTTIGFRTYYWQNSLPICCRRYVTKWIYWWKIKSNWIRSLGDNLLQWASIRRLGLTSIHWYSSFSNEKMFSKNFVKRKISIWKISPYFLPDFACLCFVRTLNLSISLSLSLSLLSSFFFQCIFSLQVFVSLRPRILRLRFSLNVHVESVRVYVFVTKVV